MEENVIGMIGKAESEAAAKKSQAQERAAEILSDAEKKAAEIIKTSEFDCARYREQALKAAEDRALSDYNKSIEDSRAEAKAYADGLLKNSENHVLDIVGRLTK